MASRSKSRSRASASKKSKSPAKKTPAKKRAPSKSPARTKTPASAPASRGRSRSVSRKPTKEETKATPKRAPSKTRVASRSSSRSRASVKTPVVKEPVAKLIKKTPAQATPSASVGRPINSGRARTFERADDSVARTLRSLTQSRERPQSATPAVTTQCCANIRGLPASICRHVCAFSSNVQTRAKNTNKYLKRRFGVWYGETIALFIVIGLLAVAVNQIIQNDPAKLRIFITNNINKAITKTANAFNQVKDAIQSKPN
ncbi:unnamed protein product [Caenorhabditis angaria]|uniref:Uncharacterized protein n=1 Tax=Caenorhabditis angaria TaxID=860376 RepID=A0A9P1I895_9PELO|nr:unnamed protein product [Caenorhabditis angaria]